MHVCCQLTITLAVHELDGNLLLSFISQTAAQPCMGQRETLLASAGPITLGEHPATGETIELKQGRFGFYLQLGTDTSPSAVHRTPKSKGRTKTSKTPAKTKPTAKKKLTAKTVSLK